MERKRDAEVSAEACGIFRGMKSWQRRSGAVCSKLLDGASNKPHHRALEPSINIKKNFGQNLNRVTSKRCRGSVGSRMKADDVEIEEPLFGLILFKFY